MTIGTQFYGRRIVGATLTDDALRLVFDDGTVIRLWDNNQQCCENRYFTCDDPMTKIIGGRLVGIESKDGPIEEMAWNYNETTFVEVRTDACFITLAAHNDHNGYYGGIELKIRIERGTDHA